MLGQVAKSELMGIVDAGLISRNALPVTQPTVSITENSEPAM